MCRRTRDLSICVISCLITMMLAYLVNKSFPGRVSVQCISCEIKKTETCPKDDIYLYHNKFSFLYKPDDYHAFVIKVLP